MKFKYPTKKKGYLLRKCMYTMYMLGYEYVSQICWKMDWGKSTKKKTEYYGEKHMFVQVFFCFKISTEFIWISSKMEKCICRLSISNPKWRHSRIYNMVTVLVTFRCWLRWYLNLNKFSIYLHWIYFYLLLMMRYCFCFCMQ